MNNNPLFVSLPRSSLIILIGISGSGKSKFAHHYFAASNIVSSDYCRKIVSDEEENQLVSQDAFDLFYQIIEKRMKYARTVIVDSTALRSKYRYRLQTLAKKYHYPIFTFLFDIDLEICHKQNLQRTRQVNPDVIKQQSQQFEKTKKEIAEKNSYTVTTSNFFNYQFQWDLPVVKVSDQESLDFLPGIYGCGFYLESILKKLGYQKEAKGYCHPENRKIVFLGNIFGGGKENILAWEIVFSMWSANNAFYIPGNLCYKLYRYFCGRKVQLTLGADRAVQQWQSLTTEAQEQIKAKFMLMYAQSPPYRVIGKSKFVAVYGGVNSQDLGLWNHQVVRNCLYQPNNNPLFPTVCSYKIVSRPHWQGQVLHLNCNLLASKNMGVFRYPEEKVTRFCC